MMDFVWLAPALPLAGAVLLLLFGSRLRSIAGGLASALVGGSFLVGLLAFRDLLALPEGGRRVTIKLFDWISVGSFVAPAEIRVDPLSMVMVLTVTGVGFLIHVYSMGYMHDDPRYPRFFAYMNLFVFAMLTLVLANNFVVLFVGWEGVGLCSYLLIAFWHDRKAAADAGKKAFIVTRIGDTAMLIGVFLMFTTTGSVRFDDVFAATPGIAAGTATAISLLLFAGAVGKSAQMPLHTWLPDAMEGPTPVSALIHAATMVTAGVYLVARAHPLFEASPHALFVVALVGVITAVYAASSALGQDDLKRLLAYSTISQLGLMFLAVGVGAYSIAIFHLVTHAFFKALMFLAAGSVMHATGGEIDMTRLGGLRREMPWTATLFVAGGLALAGVPLFAGFFSKDQILTAAFEAEHVGLWVIALVASGLTALYVARAALLTFFGTRRLEGHPHESSPVMLVPMTLLGVGAVAGGVLGLTAETGIIQTVLAPALGVVEHAAREPVLTEAALVAIATAVAVVGIALGWFVYGSGLIEWAALRVRLRALHRALARGWYMDDLYGALLVAPGKAAAAFTAFVFDQRVIDGAVNGIGRSFRGLAAGGRRVQSGLVRTYALGFLLGVVLLLILVLVRS